MSNQFKDVPAALQKQVILRLDLGILALLLSVIVSVYYRDSFAVQRSIRMTSSRLVTFFAVPLVT